MKKCCTDYLLYISAPYSGSEDDIKFNIRRVCEYAKEISSGQRFLLEGKRVVPIVPHTMFPFVTDYDQALDFCIATMLRCDGVVFLTERRTNGMIVEEKMAKIHGIDIMTLDECLDVFTRE